jgi:hypothetical protein
MMSPARLSVNFEVTKIRAISAPDLKVMQKTAKSPFSSRSWKKSLGQAPPGEGL